jgi:hypothetical protein
MGIRIGNRCCGRNYFIDSITGVIPTTSCPAICGTVASTDELPDPPEGCTFYQVVKDNARAIYEWHDEIDGWHAHSGIRDVIVNNGLISSLVFNALEGHSVILNGVTYTDSQLINISPAVYYMTVTFMDANGCRYNVDPIGEVPCYWYWDEVAGFPSCTIYPEGGAGVPMFSYQDVKPLQQDYPYFSLFISPSDLGSPLLIYAPESVVQDWEINYGIGQVPMTWLPTTPACPQQELKCYTATLDIDLTTYPFAIIQDINGIATGSSITLSPNLLSDTAALEVSLGEYLSVLYGGVVTCTITYVGTLYTIVIQNIPYYDITNPNIFPLSSITVERDAFDYVDMALINSTCP